MIHSMSGGIISDAGSYTFVKVAFDDGGMFWYVTEEPAEEGDVVKVPRGMSNAATTGRVVRVERGVSGQVTPVPLKSAKRVICVVKGK